LDHKFQHGPTAVSACDSCHTYLDAAAHTFKLRAQGRDLCTFCHINKAGSEAPVSHKPFADGECLKCHDPHGAEVRYTLRKPDINSLCLSCHQQVLEGHTSVHKAVTEKNCTACHKSHSSDHQKLLTMDTRALCLSCHQDVQHQVDSATSIHEPLKAGGADCLTCHTPHASDTTHQLKAPPAQLCADCHKDVAKVAADASNPHSAVSTGEACLNCHKPHGSEHAKLMKDDPVSTCLACHKETPKLAATNKQADNPAKPVFVDQSPTPAPETSKPTTLAKPVPELANKSLNPHGPVAEGKCAACHDVHGGSNPNLLKAAFSDDFYKPFAPENFALCFTCHDAKLAAAQNTSDATNFRDGERNLHFLHVNKEQGRSCIACHTVHASQFQKQICENVTYGNWKLPINFKPSDTGGSCAPGCHRPHTYTRTAVKIPVKEPVVPPATPTKPPARPGD
jgi:predicted CXXCH cytochrome family protein